MRQAAKYNIQATEALPQLLALSFVDAEGEALDVSGMSLRGAVLQDGGIVDLVCEMTGANTALVSWPRLVAGCGRYDLFLTDEAGKEYPLLRGGVHVAERVTPADESEVEGSGAVAGGLVVTIPEAVDGAVTICEDCSVAAGSLIAETLSAVKAQEESSVAAVQAAGAEGVQMAGMAEQYAVQAFNSAQSAARLDEHALESAQRAEAAASEVGGHVVDAAMHVSEAQRAAWNNKADLAGVESFLEGSDHVFRGKNEFKERVTASNGAKVRCGVVMGYRDGDEVFVDGRSTAALEVYPTSEGSVVRTHIYCPPVEMGGGPLNDDDMLLTRAEVVELVEGLLASRGIE